MEKITQLSQEKLVMRSDKIKAGNGKFIGERDPKQKRALRLFKRFTGGSRITLITQMPNGNFRANAFKPGRQNEWVCLGYFEIPKEIYDEDRRIDPRQGEI